MNIEQAIEEFEREFPASDITDDDDKPVTSLYTRTRIKRLLTKTLTAYRDSVIERVEGMDVEEHSQDCCEFWRTQRDQLIKDL